jgi:hypothetical protein
MGRQMQLSMLPADGDALLAEIQSHGFVEITTREGDSNKVQPIASLLGTEGQTLILWNKKLAPNLQRNLIENATTVYYRVDESALPVLEFSTSLLTEWSGRPALTQGPHLWAVWGGKSAEFEKWYERIVRHIRRRWRRNPVSLLSGYVGPAAYEWFKQGACCCQCLLHR